MSKHNDFNSIGQVYGKMLSNVKHKLVKEGKAGPGVKPGSIGEAPLQSGGPTERGGFKPASVDKTKLSQKELEDNLYNVDRLSDGEAPTKKNTKNKGKKRKTVKEMVKNDQSRLNNFMRRKSIFDKLYENVMSGPDTNSMGMGAPDTGMSETEELDALGVDTDLDEGEGDGEEITLTLDRETATKLHDMLMSALGEGETEDEDLGDELESDDDMGLEDEDENEYGMSDEDEEELGHTNVNAKEPNMGKNNKVGNLKPSGGQASSAYTNKVGDDGDHGHALVNAKEPNMGKNNKVGTLKTGKPMFQQ
jgi:hypothetical protein